MPLTPQTRGMIGQRELALMPKGAFLVNTARAGLIDSAALITTLKRGHLGGAALDVLDVEPPTSEHPAPIHPRLIITPHAGWFSPQSEQEVYRRAASAVRAVLEGKEPDGIAVRPSVR
jgi:phosphoglycerate dehydrogenase-like enzyme